MSNHTAIRQSRARRSSRLFTNVAPPVSKQFAKGNYDVNFLPIEEVIPIISIKRVKGWVPTTEQYDAKKSFPEVCPLPKPVLGAGCYFTEIPQLPTSAHLVSNLYPSPDKAQMEPTRTKSPSRKKRSRSAEIVFKAGKKLIRALTPSRSSKVMSDNITVKEKSRSGTVEKFDGKKETCRGADLGEDNQSYDSRRRSRSVSKAVKSVVTAIKSGMTPTKSRQAKDKVTKVATNHANRVHPLSYTTISCNDKNNMYMLSTTKKQLINDRGLPRQSQAIGDNQSLSYGNCSRNIELAVNNYKNEVLNQFDSMNKSKALGFDYCQSLYKDQQKINNAFVVSKSKIMKLK